MAIRINTVEYGWETLQTAVSGSTPVAGAEKLVYIPETGSRTFLSADLEMFMRDANTGTTIISGISTWQMSCSIDSNITGITTTGQSLTTTGDHTCIVFKRDFTGAFNQRFTGSFHRVTPMFNFPTANAGRWNGHSFKLTLTYQFDDTGANTRIKTARLPLDCIFTTLLPTSASVFGKQTGGYTNIPALDTFLPESQKSIRDIWIEYRGLDISAATTNVAMATQIDSGSMNSRMTIFGSMNTDTVIVDYQNISGSLDTSTAHTLKASASLATRLSNISPILYCSYEYDSSTSNKILNSCIIPLSGPSYNSPNISSVKFKDSFKFLIPEQDPYLINSAVIISYGLINTNPRLFKINNVDILKNTTFARGTTPSGNANFNIRFDSEASSSANVTLTPGYNSLDFEVTGSTFSLITSVANNIHPILLLNYTSSKLSNGVIGHNSIISFTTSSIIAQGTGNTTLSFITGSVSNEIKDSYYINAITTNLLFNSSTATGDSFSLSRTDSNPDSNVSSSIGYSIQRHLNNQAELSFRCFYFNTEMWMKYPKSSNIFPNKQNFFSPTIYNFLNLTQINTGFGITNFLTYQQNTFRITGSLLNCNQTGVNYEVDIILSGSNVPTQPIYVLNSSGSGTTKWFTFDWYEDINKLYAVTQYPERGISNLATASSGQGILTIDYSTPTAGGEHSFTFIG